MEDKLYNLLVFIDVCNAKTSQGGMKFLKFLIRGSICDIKQ